MTDLEKTINDIEQALKDCDLYCDDCNKGRGEYCYPINRGIAENALKLLQELKYGLAIIDETQKEICPKTFIKGLPETEKESYWNTVGNWNGLRHSLRLLGHDPDKKDGNNELCKNQSGSGEGHS